MTYGQMDYRKIDSRSKLRKLGERLLGFDFCWQANSISIRKNSNYLKLNFFLSSLSAELEAYSSLVNAFRAQGNFTKEKKKILNDLRSFLR